MEDNDSCKGLAGHTFCKGELHLQHFSSDFLPGTPIFPDGSQDGGKDDLESLLTHQ